MTIDVTPVVNNGVNTEALIGARGAFAQPRKLQVDQAEHDLRRRDGLAERQRPAGATVAMAGGGRRRPRRARRRCRRRARGSGAPFIARLHRFRSPRAGWRWRRPRCRRRVKNRAH